MSFLFCIHNLVILSNRTKSGLRLCYQLVYNISSSLTQDLCFLRAAATVTSAVWYVLRDSSDSWSKLIVDRVCIMSHGHWHYSWSCVYCCQEFFTLCPPTSCMMCGTWATADNFKVEFRRSRRETGEMCANETAHFFFYLYLKGKVAFSFHS